MLQVVDITVRDKYGRPVKDAEVICIKTFAFPPYQYVYRQHTQSQGACYFYVWGRLCAGHWKIEAKRYYVGSGTLEFDAPAGPWIKDVELRFNGGLYSEKTLGD
jgi:hypothetical protein